MPYDELVEQLREMYNNPLYETRRHRSIVPALFGIRYADRLQGHNVSDIAEDATGHRSYGVEINKGTHLATYVSMRRE